MNSEQNQALEFGVPLRETCEKMEWQRETHFYWHKFLRHEPIENTPFVEINGMMFPKLKYTSEYLLCCLKDDGYLHSLTTNDTARMYFDNKVIRAPQMQKIAEDLPPKFHKEILGFGKEGFDFFYKYSNDGDDLIHRIGYRAQFNYDIRIDIRNNHYAQAYAELWLKLKSENLL